VLLGFQCAFGGIDFFVVLLGARFAVAVLLGGSLCIGFFKTWENKNSLAPRKAPWWPLRAPLTTQHAHLRAASWAPSTTPGMHSSALGTREVGVVIFFYEPPKSTLISPKGPPEV